ncbi:hypothetical protein IAQ61_007100 [Plenodomus lingam]|uniref:uncharacterized protein n=1 Tax=Leptosphaeria maculans TaxID=5022 RepID=UPI00331AD1E7|nr:hypothetical protein IAQ61_007100 [Plenodomus lingam]
MSTKVSDIFNGKSRTWNHLARSTYTDTSVYESGSTVWDETAIGVTQGSSLPAYFKLTLCFDGRVGWCSGSNADKDGKNDGELHGDDWVDFGVLIGEDEAEWNDVLEVR